MRPHFLMHPSEDDFWEDLLSLIEDGKVIPVIGERAVTIAPDDAPLYPLLARKLAERLPVPAEKLGDDVTLHHVAAEWIRGNGTRATLYTRLNRVLRDGAFAPGTTLRALASIPAFNLFLTTTFDRLTERAVNEARFGGAERTQVFAYVPETPVDLPERKSRLGVPTVYHLLGRISSAPEYVLWEDDVIEFVCGLHQHLPVMEKLARDLKEHGLLIFGLNFSDWLVRFFLRITKQSRLSEPRLVTEYLAEGASLPESMVLFFGGVVKNLNIVNSEPADFAAELARRWHARHPDSAGASVQFATALPQEMPHGAIFLSYSREDTAAAEALRLSLESAGCVVWFDRECVRPGETWQRTMEEEVSQRASLFVSVISRQTESRAGECHRERAWAEARQLREGGATFYIPVVVDDTRAEQLQREVPLVRRLHLTPLPGGGGTPEFASHLLGLQKQRAPHLFPPA